MGRWLCGAGPVVLASAAATGSGGGTANLLAAAWRDRQPLTQWSHAVHGTGALLGLGAIVVTAIKLAKVDQLEKVKAAVDKYGTKLEKEKMATAPGRRSFRGELETYSERTLALLHRDLLAMLASGGSLSEKVYDFLVRASGYDSLAEAEKKLRLPSVPDDVASRTRLVGTETS